MIVIVITILSSPIFNHPCNMDIDLALPHPLLTPLVLVPISLLWGAGTAGVVVVEVVVGRSRDRSRNRRR